MTPNLTLFTIPFATTPRQTLEVLVWGDYFRGDDDELKLLQESVVDVADVPRQAALHISKCAAAGWVRDGSRRER